ncbi:signal peptidase I [Oscillospiraceae bacterium OttesenSCG-928-G22]|nr:signal peptidase I [Oscillospiraceae bacterium OttesenSCG-928-G22]
MRDDDLMNSPGVPPEPEEQKKESFSLKSELYDWAQALVFALVFVVLLNTFVVRIIGVDGHSMMQTLHDGDRIVLSGLFYEPEPGDIVVLTKKSFRSEPIVKRVIAVAGQTIDINFITHEVFVDGVLQDEPYINEPTVERGDMEFPLTVEEGCIFVMGDNRNRSTDSRWSTIGMVDTRAVLGKVYFRIYPFNNISRIQ